MTRVIFSASRAGKGIVDFRQRALWHQKYANRALKTLEIEVRCHGELPDRGLIVSNHLSYLDVLAIASQGPAIFVAKSDLAGWPVIGTLLKYAGTILAYRNQPLKAAQTAIEIQTALSSGLSVVLFPEGTSTNGETVRPFRSPFFQPAQEVSAAITPAAIHYTSESGDPQNDICYWGEHTFFSHVIKLVTLQNVVAHLSFGETHECCSDRKESALYFHEEVTRAHVALKGLVGIADLHE